MGRPLDIVFCGTGWLPMVDHLRARLPAEAKVRVRDYAKPMPESVAGANVILPSNARIDAATIAAPEDLILIQQPAVGIEGVDLEAGVVGERGAPAVFARVARLLPRVRFQRRAVFDRLGRVRERVQRRHLEVEPREHRDDLARLVPIARGEHDLHRVT